MRQTSPKFETEIAKSITTPGFLIEIAFTVPFRLSTRGSVRFGGVSFQERGFAVSGLTPSADTSQQRGAVTIEDLDRTLTYWVLSEGVTERTIRVWQYYGDVAVGADVEEWNPVEVFRGYGDECQIDPNNGRVTIQLIGFAARTSSSPRIRLTKENGFNWLPPRGQVIEFGGQKYEIETER